MDWTQQAKQLFNVPKPEHFTNYRHCGECAEHDATLLAQDVHSIGIEHLGNPGWDPLCFASPDGFVYYLPALIRITLDTMEKPQERYLDQLLFHLMRDGKDHALVRACSPAQRACIAGFLEHLMDPEVLARAAQDGRVLVTHDRKTMPQHFAAFITTVTSAGVLIIPQHVSMAAAVDALLLIWHTTEAEEWFNQIRSLPL